MAVACGLGQVRTARSLDPRAAVVEGRRNPPNQAGSGRSCGEDTRLNHSTAEKNLLPRVTSVCGLPEQGMKLLIITITAHRNHKHSIP